VTLLLLLVACAGSDPAADRARFVEGLRSGDCSAIVDAALADECREANAKAPEDCDRIGGEKARGECYFQVAEERGDASLCPKAAPYADDCALHVLSRSFLDWLPRGAKPGAHEAEAEKRIVAAGLAADDMRPWSAFYRHVLGASRPIDRAACAAVPDAARAEACARTGIAMYQDLLNMARDRGVYPCDGGPLPPLLSYTPDPELDAVRAARTDLCPAR